MTQTGRIVATLGVGLTIYVGVPLLAWGAGDLPAFAGNGARLAYVVTAALLCAYAAIRIPEVGKVREPSVARVARQRWAVPLLQVLSISLLVAAPYGDRRDVAAGPDLASIRIAGVGLFVAGFLMMHWAEAALGRQFSLEVAIQRDHRLISGGLYRYVRHPRYLGILLFTCGIALVFRSAAGLALTAGIAAVLLWRIHDEESLMEARFGAEWRAYASRTWRLIPLLF